MRSLVAVVLFCGAACALVYTVLRGQAVAAQSSNSEVVRSELLGPQQFVYAEQATLGNGERVAIFVPSHPVGIAVQIRSGSRAMILGEIVSCRPFTETEQIGDRKASMQLMNCGAPAHGQPDRIVAVVALRWQ